jgi:tetratricopeptide (TPR) repeat protein
MLSYQRYEVALATIDSMQSKYAGEKVQAFLRFVQSNIYHRMEQWEKEIECLEQFKEIGQEYQDIPQVELNFAVAYKESKMYEKSERSFRRAIELMGGTYPLAHCNLGLLYVEMGEMEKAEEQLEKAEQSHAPDFSLQALRRHLQN